MVGCTNGWGSDFNGFILPIWKSWFASVWFCALLGSCLYILCLWIYYHPCIGYNIVMGSEPFNTYYQPKPKKYSRLRGVLEGSSRKETSKVYHNLKQTFRLYLRTFRSATYSRYVPLSRVSMVNIMRTIGYDARADVS